MFDYRDLEPNVKTHMEFLNLSDEGNYFIRVISNPIVYQMEFKGKKFNKYAFNAVDLIDKKIKIISCGYALVEKIATALRDCREDKRYANIISFWKTMDCLMEVKNGSQFDLIAIFNDEALRVDGKFSPILKIIKSIDRSKPPQYATTWDVNVIGISKMKEGFINESFYFHANR